MVTKNSKKQPKPISDQIETLKGLPQTLSDSFISHLGAGTMTSMWEQVLGGDRFSKEIDTTGELKEGEELDLKEFAKKKETKKVNVEPGLDYRREILQAERKVLSENQQELQVKIQEILIEIKRLIATSSELRVEFREVAKDQRVVKPGKYHLNFFQHVLSLLRSARLRVESAASWLAVFKSKKNQKQYWAMFKKHGTTFGLSNERVVATQTG